MKAWIEFHDSTISRIAHEGTRVDITLDAYVHRWDRIGGTWKGTGWSQPIQIVMSASAASGAPSGLPVELDGGEVRVGDATHCNLVPLPFTSSGRVSLRLELVTGDVSEFVARDIAIEPIADGRYIEDLPHADRPEAR